MRGPYQAVAGAAALAVAAAVGLGACGDSATGTGASGAAKASQTTAIKTLQFVNPLPDTAVWRQVGDCIEAQAKARGIDFAESGPPASKAGDDTVMIQQVRDAVTRRKDAIITFPASAAFGPVLQQAQKAGIVTGTLYGDGSPESGATVNAGVDWGVIGEKYVDAIAALPGQQVVGLVAQGPTGVGKSWTDGVKAAAAKTDNVRVKDTVYIGADASRALPQVSSLLTANRDINLVASNTGLMTQGGVAAIRAKGLRNRVRLLVINDANGGPEAVRNGYAIGVYLQDLCDLGKRTVDGLLQASKGQKVPLIEVNDVIATKENIDEYLAKDWK